MKPAQSLCFCPTLSWKGRNSLVIDLSKNIICHIAKEWRAELTCSLNLMPQAIGPSTAKKYDENHPQEKAGPVVTDPLLIDCTTTIYTWPQCGKSPRRAVGDVSLFISQSQKLSLTKDQKIKASLLSGMWRPDTGYRNLSGVGSLYPDNSDILY